MPPKRTEGSASASKTPPSEASDYWDIGESLRPPTFLGAGASPPQNLSHDNQRPAAIRLPPSTHSPTIDMIDRRQRQLLNETEALERRVDSARRELFGDPKMSDVRERMGDVADLLTSLEGDQSGMAQRVSCLQKLYSSIAIESVQPGLKKLNLKGQVSTIGQLFVELEKIHEAEFKKNQSGSSAGEGELIDAAS